jgi:hypothetical protein
MLGSAIYGNPVKFTITVNTPGTLDMFIDLNGVPGYQLGTTDVEIVKNINAGADTIVWNGKDGLGNYVAEGYNVQVSFRFATGVSHFPTYDIETNIHGYKVTEVRPDTGSRILFWDDSNIPGGTTNIDDTTNTTGHPWPWFFGDKNTMNSWWNGSGKSGTSLQFTIGSPLPVEFLDLNAKVDNDHVNVYWSTASETNNNYFSVERSADGMNFEPLGNVKGAGNSNTVLLYGYIDDNPVKGVSYYRIKQTDFNGNFKYSKTVTVSFDNNNTGVKITANSGMLNIMVNTPSSTSDVSNGSSIITLSPALPSNMIYIVRVSMYEQKPVASKVFMN